MIHNKADLRKYLDADKLALGRVRNSPSLHDLIWRYEIALRKAEYFYNKSIDLGGY